MNRKKLNKRKRTILAVRKIDQLGMVLGVPPHVLILQAGYPKYETFYVTKRNGGKRLIENPNDELKSIQRKLNSFLQVVYFHHKTKAAHGFVLNIKKCKPRSIKSNALQHLHMDYLVNIDIKDFFHSIPQKKVDQIFTSKYFNFDYETAMLLSDLCCYNGRLPMGAPTSPALSNFFTIDLDRQLSQLANGFEIKYSRYADDMSFSSKAFIGDVKSAEIFKRIHQYGLQVNPEKVKYFGPGTQKIVTGIYVGDKLSVAPTLLEDTKKEINKLRNVVELSKRYHRKIPKWAKNYQQKIGGYLEFTKQVMGNSHPILKQLQKDFNRAMNPPKPTDPISWQDLPYEFL